MDLQKAESTSEVVKQDVVKSNGDIANEDTEEMGLLVYSDSEDEIALKEDRGIKIFKIYFISILCTTFFYF